MSLRGGTKLPNIHILSLSCRTGSPTTGTTGAADYWDKWDKRWVAAKKLQFSAVFCENLQIPVTVVICENQRLQNAAHRKAATLAPRKKIAPF